MPSSEPPSAAVGRPPTSSSELDVSGLDLDTEAEVALDEALQYPDLMVVGGLDRHSDSPAPSSPTAERALDDALRRATGRRRSSTPVASSSPPAEVYLPTEPCPPAASYLPPAEEYPPGTSDLPSMDSPPVDDVLDDSTRAPHGRPQLRLADLLATVRGTGVAHAEAVADRLEEHYQVNSGGEALHLQTILICMHTSRQDVIRQLRDEAVRLRMIGANSDLILWAALRFFDTVLIYQSTL